MKLKIAHLVNQLYYAGKEIGIIKISRAMDHAAFEVDIIVLGHIHLEAACETNGLQITELGKPPGNDPKIVLQLARFFRERRYHIVHTHAWNTLLEGYAAAVLAGIPVKVHGEHGTFERSRLKDSAQRWAWRRMDAVTVVAGELQQKMATEFRYRGDNVTVIHNGIDAHIFHPAAELRNAFRLAHRLTDKFVVGTVGRFHPVKDHPTLLRGFARFREQAPAAHLVLVGGEPDSAAAAQYRELIRELGVQDAVTLLPKTAHVAQAVNGFDVFVLSSISEGCSNVILEAQACGVPVIATRTGGNPELIHDGRNGLLFEVGDALGLAAGLSRMHAGSVLRERLRAEGLRVIAEQFTLANTVTRYQNLYTTLAERAGITVR